MAAISTWSKTAASNNSPAPDGAPEGMNPSGVNDVIRENMAALRTRFEDLEWFGHGHTLVRQSANSFLVSVTATAIYTAGRRIKLFDATTIYGEVLSSSPSGANTLVTVSSSALTASLSSGEVSILDPTNVSIPTATQAQQEAAAATNVFTTPASQHFHPGSLKGWVRATTAGVATVSYNVSSVTDVGTGRISVQWDTNFSSANYVAIGNTSQSDSASVAGCVVSNTTAPSAGTTTFNSTRDSGTHADPELAWFICAMGDQ